MAVAGVMFIGPALDTFATWTVQAANERHWVESPLSEFVDFDGIIAYDIAQTDEFQKMRTIGDVYEAVGAKGIHEMKCLINGTIGENGYVEQGTEDVEIYSYSWEDPWNYEPRKSKDRGVWTIPINSKALQKCPTNQVYWVAAITIIMPNGYERSPIVLTSTVADVEPLPKLNAQHETES